jgi:hypothetical protein
MVMCFAFLIGCSSVRVATNPSTIRAYKPDTPESAKKLRATLVGKWLGQAVTDDGRIRKWMSEKRADGSLKIHFRTYNKDGEYEEQFEVGLWGVSGPIYFTIIRAVIVNAMVNPIDPTDPYFYDAYEIIKLTGQEFECREVTTGDTYKAKKVADDFELPEEKRS